MHICYGRGPTASHLSKARTSFPAQGCTLPGGLLTMVHATRRRALTVAPRTKSQREHLSAAAWRSATTRFPRCGLGATDARSASAWGDGPAGRGDSPVEQVHGTEDLELRGPASPSTSLPFPGLRILVARRSRRASRRTAESRRDASTTHDRLHFVGPALPAVASSCGNLWSADARDDQAAFRAAPGVGFPLVLRLCVSEVE